MHVVQANVLFGDPILGLPGAMQPQSMIIDDAGVSRLGFSRIHRVFTGSISSRVAAHAHCPVTVVHEGWFAEGRTGVVVGASADKSDGQVLGHALEEATRLGEPVAVSWWDERRISTRSHTWAG